MSTDFDLWKALGLARNEVKIYETLLQEGESSVGLIVAKSKIHRRNVYDSLKRLLEKGLVFEILQKREGLYQAVDPHKLGEMLDEKQQALSVMMPRLLSLYGSKTRREEIYIYRGLEAYKNEMRDVLRIGQDMYTIGGKGLWTDVRLKGSLERFVSEASKKKMTFHVLWDQEVGERSEPLTESLPTKSKTLPSKFSTPSVIDIFGDHIAIFSEGNVTGIDEDIVLTVIINERIADTFRTWFQLIWDSI